MRRGKFSEEQIIGILKEHEAALSAVEVCRKYGVSDGSSKKGGRSRFGGRMSRMSRKLRALDGQKRKLLDERLLAEKTCGPRRGARPPQLWPNGATSTRTYAARQRQFDATDIYTRRRTVMRAAAAGWLPFNRFARLPQDQKRRSCRDPKFERRGAGSCLRAFDAQNRPIVISGNHTHLLLATVHLNSIVLQLVVTARPSIKITSLVLQNLLNSVGFAIIFDKSA